MNTKIFCRFSHLLFLFQISCFVALQRIPLHSSSFSGCSDEHKKIDVICNIHSGELQIEPKNLGNELLVYGFIREFEAIVVNKKIPDCIMSLCVGFSRRMLPCNCIKEKYREILPKLDINEYRKKALIFFLMYKIEDVRDKGGDNILHCAAEKGQVEIVKLLKKWGANIHAKNEFGNNALHFACLWSKSVPMVKWLLDECKMDLEAKGYAQRTPFFCAAKGGQLKIAKLLKEHGANIHAKSESGSNALHAACFDSGSVAMVKWLLDECKLGLETKGGYDKLTPFTCAASTGQLEIAKLLKERGAYINAKSKSGDNALHAACYFSDSVPMVKWLLDECKIDIDSKGSYQRIPFLFAAEYGRLAIAKLLKQRGTNINAKDKYRNNALHLAKNSWEKSEEMISYLKSLRLT